MIAPSASAQISSVGYIDGTIAPDYDAFRQLTHSNADSPFATRLRAIPANGTILKSMASLGGN